MVTRSSQNKDEHGIVCIKTRRHGRRFWWVVPYGAFERLCGLMRGKMIIDCTEIQSFMISNSHRYILFRSMKVYYVPLWLHSLIIPYYKLIVRLYLIKHFLFQISNFSDFYHYSHSYYSILYFFPSDSQLVH